MIGFPVFKSLLPEGGSRVIAEKMMRMLVMKKKTTSSSGRMQEKSLWSGLSAIAQVVSFSAMISISER